MPTDLGNLSRALKLKCKLCPWIPPEDSKLEASQLHFQVEHDQDEVQYALVAFCTCGTSMTHTETRPTGGGFKDYLRCDACGNTGFIKRKD